VPQIQAGRQLEALTAIDAGGALATVKLPSTEAEKLLIITFSPVCPACRKNTPGWRRLTQALRGRDSWRVVWVSRNLEKATRQYCEEQRLPLANVFWDPSHRTYLQLGLESVPNIMAVDYGGVVRKIWAGVLDSQTWKEIAEYTNVPYQSILDEHALLTEHAY
jgi:hypothetical protein